MGDTLNQRSPVDDGSGRRERSEVDRILAEARGRGGLSRRSTFLTSIFGPRPEDELWDVDANEEVAEEFEDEEEGVVAEELKNSDPEESRSVADEWADHGSLSAGTQGGASPHGVDDFDLDGRTTEWNTQKSSNMNNLGTIGRHLLTKTSFTIEIVSNRVVRGAIFAMYASVIASIVCEQIYAFTYPVEEYPIAILPPGGSRNEQDDPVCIPSGNELCEAAIPEILTSEAKSLVNTAVVSDGLDYNKNWVGAKAKPGTPPFSSFTSGNVVRGDILLDSSELVYDANPSLHNVWDNITAVVWIGFKGSFESKIRLFSQRIQFINTAGDWPASVGDEGMPVLIEGYACTHGKNCSDIGSWRHMLVDGPYTEYQPLTVAKGNMYFPYISQYRYTIGTEIVAALGWRILILGDPGNAVSACVKGTDCVAKLLIGGYPHYPALVKIAFLVLLIGYSIYLLGWAWCTYKRRGTFGTWACEQKWLLVAGIGFILVVNPIRVGLLNESQPAFNEQLWAAALILSQLGVCMVFFAFACFCDAPRWYVSSIIGFYGYKALFCLTLFAVYVIYTLSHFPEVIGYDESGTSNQIGDLGHLTATKNWPSELKAMMTATAITVLALTLLSILYYLRTSYKSRRVLKKLPYGTTRPMQLSFRFFFWATGLVVAVMLARYIADIIRADAEQVTYSGNVQNDALTRIAVAMKSYNLEGRITSIFEVTAVAVFLVIFQFLFLPVLPSYLQCEKTHFLYARDVEDDTTEGKRLILEWAQLLVVCSREVYLPFSDDEREIFFPVPKETEEESSDEADRESITMELDDVNAQPTLNSSGGSAAPPDTHFACRLAGDEGPAPGLTFGGTCALGLRVVARISEPVGADLHDTKVIIFRNDATNDLIVSFRGTKTKKQMKTDAMQSKVSVSLSSFLTMPSRTCCWVAKEEHSLLSVDYEAMLRMGELVKVRLHDLLHKEDHTDLPDYLRKSAKAPNGHHGKGRGKLHFGFWSSYNRVRRELHLRVKAELLESPGRLMLTGHSLGGAQATLCAYDMCKYVVPTVRKMLLMKTGRSGSDVIRVSCYTFGSPRVGDSAFRAAYNELVPDSQRVVCEGDIISAVPPEHLGFRHVGRENIFDQAGGIRVNPSLIEKNFTMKRTRVNSHRMGMYQQSITNASCPDLFSEEKAMEKIRLAYNSSLCKRGEGGK